MENLMENILGNISTNNVELNDKMFTICVQNLICKYINNEFMCYLCKNLIKKSTSILEHVRTDKYHQDRRSIEKISDTMNELEIDDAKSREMFLNSIVVIDVSRFRCIICASNFNSLEDVHSHIKESEHINIIESKNMNNIVESEDVNITKDVMNSIEPIVSIYKCSICKLALKANAEYKYHKMFHLSPERHACSNIDIINFSMQEDKTKFMHCSLCDKILVSEKELEEHVNSVTHSNWIYILNHTSESTLYDDQQNIEKKLIDKNMVYSTNTEAIEFIQSYLYCCICELDILNSDDPSVRTEHKISKTHVTNMSSMINNKKSELICISKDCSSPGYICFICNVEFSQEKRLYSHYNKDIHKSRVNVLYELTSDKYINLISSTSKSKLHVRIQCTLCNVQAGSIRCMLQHKSGSKHNKRKLNEKVYSSNKTVNKTTIYNKIPLHLLPDSSNNIKFSCYVCETNVPDFMLMQHLKYKSHMKLLKSNNNNVRSTSSKGNKLFSCLSCKESFSSDLQLIEHFRDGKHQDCDQTKISNESNANESNKCQLISDQKLAPNNHDENIFAKPDTSVSYSKERPKLRRPRRIYNLSEIGKNYIELCIESSDKNIYNFDVNTMYKLRLGVTLSLPIETDRRFCIPCNKEMSSDLEILNSHLHSDEHRRKMIEMVASDKPHSTDLNDYLNDFRLACSYMRRSSENASSVLCFACLTKIENLNSSIYDHTKSKVHQDNCLAFEMSSEIIFQNLTKTWRNAWYFTEKFVCDVCSIVCDSEIEFANHTMQDPHVQSANKALGHHQALESYVCIYCATYWCTRVNLYASHCNDSAHKLMLETRAHAIPTFDDSVLRILNDYERTIGLLLHNSDKIDGDDDDDVDDAEESLLKLLESLVRDKYPKVKAHLFGSRLSRTNFHDADLDVYLDCDDTYRDSTTVERSRELLSEVLTCFGKHEKSWTVEDANLTTKALAIKLQNKALNLRCNIQCDSGLVVEKSKLIRFFVKICPDCRRLILFLKKWMLCCRLSGAKDPIFTDNAISILVIFYLQVENILPSLSYLIEQKNRSNIVAGWETGFLVDETSLPQQMYAVKDHLSRFFNFYAEFNYITDVICPFLGRSLQKRDFVNTDKLPKEMDIYKRLCKRGNAVEVFRFYAPMCVQDPIELSENLTAIVTKKQLRMFRQYCLESRKILDKGII